MNGPEKFTRHRERAIAKARRRVTEYRIEGDAVSLTDIADRLGASRSSACRWMQKAARMEGPITWERLEEMRP